MPLYQGAGYPANYFTATPTKKKSLQFQPGTYSGQPLQFQPGVHDPSTPVPVKPVSNPYAQTPFASLNGPANVNSYQQRTGQVPNKTYGGMFGQALPNPENAPTIPQHFAANTGNQYAPTGRGLGLAPTTAGGYKTAMDQQNPGGRLFGGALPAYGTSSGGETRPMFMGPPTQGGNFAGSFPRNDYEETRTGALTPTSASTRLLTDAAQKRFLAAHPNDVPLEQRYHSLGLATPEERGANRFQRSTAKADARKFRLGIGEPLDMAMRANPGIAGGIGLARLNNANSQAWANVQQKMQADKLAAMKEQAQNQTLLGLAGHIAGADMPPGEKAAYMDQITGKLGLAKPAGVPRGSATGTPQQRANYYLTPKQQGELRGMKTAQEKEQFLNQHGVTDTVTRQNLLGVGQSPPPSLFDMGSAAAQGGMTGLLGLLPWMMTPSPSRPTRKRGPSGRSVPITPAAPATDVSPWVPGGY